MEEIQLWNDVKDWEFVWYENWFDSCSELKIESNDMDWARERVRIWYFGIFWPLFHAFSRAKRNYSCMWLCVFGFVCVSTLYIVWMYDALQTSNTTRNYISFALAAPSDYVCVYNIHLIKCHRMHLQLTPSKFIYLIVCMHSHAHPLIFCIYFSPN